MVLKWGGGGWVDLTIFFISPNYSILLINVIKEREPLIKIIANITKKRLKCKKIQYKMFYLCSISNMKQPYLGHGSIFSIDINNSVKGGDEKYNIGGSLFKKTLTFSRTVGDITIKWTILNVEINLD